MRIKDLKNPWRDKWQNASFRGERFFVEGDMRSSGRRVVVHEYPKRNVPYSEDMGRVAVQIKVQGYLIGPKYLDLKNALIAALEKDGPGMLRLPLPYQMADIKVMVNSYSVTEARERGGFCTVDMQFSEYGDPSYREVISTGEAIDKSANDLEKELTKQRQQGDASYRAKLRQMYPYSQIYAGTRQWLARRNAVGDTQ